MFSAVTACSVRPDSSPTPPRPRSLLLVAAKGTIPFSTMAPTLALLESSPNVVRLSPYLLSPTPTPHLFVLISSTIISIERCCSWPVAKNLSDDLSDMGCERLMYPSNAALFVDLLGPRRPGRWLRTRRTDGSRAEVSWPESPPRRRTSVFLVTWAAARVRVSRTASEERATAGVDPLVILLPIVVKWPPRPLRCLDTLTSSFVLPSS